MADFCSDVIKCGATPEFNEAILCFHSFLAKELLVKNAVAPSSSARSHSLVPSDMKKWIANQVLSVKGASIAQRQELIGCLSGSDVYRSDGNGISDFLPESDVIFADKQQLKDKKIKPSPVS